MRLKELLLEYSHDTTLANFGKALVAHVKEEAKNNEYARGFISNKFVSEEFMSERILEVIETKIPKKYVVWAIRTYLNGGIRFFEDMGKAGEFVQQHTELRQSGYFKRNPEANAQFGDLGRIKKLNDLGAFLMSVKKADAMSNSEKDRQYEKELISSGQAEIRVDDNNFKVIIPKSKEAAIWFGRNTQWCTSATKSDNMFDYYSEDGPLYIILEKKTNSRWQLHLESNQFMDENDKEVSFNELLKFPYKQFLLQNELSPKAIAMLLKHYHLDKNYFKSIIDSMSKVDLCNVICILGNAPGNLGIGMLKEAISKKTQKSREYTDENDVNVIEFDDGVDFMLFILSHRLADVRNLHVSNFFNQPLQGRNDIGTLLATHRTHGAIISKNDDYILIAKDQYIHTIYTIFSDFSGRGGESSLDELLELYVEFERRIDISARYLDDEADDEEYEELTQVHQSFIDAYFVTNRAIEYLRKDK